VCGSPPAATLRGTLGVEVEVAVGGCRPASSYAFLFNWLRICDLLHRTEAELREDVIIVKCNQFNAAGFYPFNQELQASNLAYKQAKSSNRKCADNIMLKYNSLQSITL
jgi:hypothetical protein